MLSIIIIIINFIFQECYNFTKWNFEIIAEASDFGNIEPDVLIHYLQQNDLVIHNEMSLYK